MGLILFVSEVLPKLMREKAVQAYQDAALANAHIEVQKVQGHCERYLMQKGKCPEDMEALKVAGIISRASADHWGNNYVIRCPGEHGSVDVSSNGPDGKPGGGDDINSWDKG